PVETWAELTFGFRLPAGSSPTGAKEGEVDLSDFRVASTGATSLRLVEAELQVLEFDVATPTQVASGKLGVSTSAGAAPLLVLPWKDLPVGEGGKRKIPVTDPQALAPLLGMGTAAFRLEFTLDDTPANFNLLTRLRLEAAFD
ncbi:MAG: hypothetical protein RL653_1897, partial [Pseudomonadota bacterium]